MRNVNLASKKGNQTKEENFRQSQLYQFCQKNLKILATTIYLLWKYPVQVCLMLEKWKLAVDKNETFGARPTDLSKVFDCLGCGLLIAKLHCYDL